ncbi:MAG: hypothetical protein HY319_14270 [Armatimonadetes bacterium]|nr:hypothetical protein [Armatimonadota bacterium]
MDEMDATARDEKGNRPPVKPPRAPALKAVPAVEAGGDRIQELEEKDRQLEEALLHVRRLEKLVGLLERTSAPEETVRDDSRGVQELRGRNQALIARLRVREQELEHVRNQLLSSMVAREEAERQISLLSARARLAEQEARSLRGRLKS